MVGTFRHRRWRCAFAMWIWCCAIQFVTAQTSATSVNSWTPVGPQTATVFSLEADPFDSSTLYAGTYFGGLYRSVDRGQTWVHIPGPFSSYSIFSLIVDSRQRGRIFVGTFQAGVFVSNDAGRTWKAINNGLGNLNVQQITLDPADPQHLMITTNSGIFYTRDAGQNWLPQSDGDKVQFPRCTTFDPRNARISYAGTSGSGIYRSEDGGKTWTSFSTGLINPVVVDMKSSTTSGIVYAAVSNGVYRLSPGATRWVNISENLPADLSGAQIVIDSSITSEPMIYFSTDKGVYSRREGDSEQGWTLWTPQPARLVLFRDGYSLLARFGGGLRASVDNGRSFFPRENGIQNLFVGALGSIARNGGSRTLAGGDSGVFFSSDDRNWTKSPNFTEGVFRFLVDPNNNSTVFAGTERAGVWKSVDGGENWQSSAEGIVPPGFFGLAYSAEAGVLYAATTSGLYISRNGGERWGQDQVLGTLGTAFSVATDRVEKNRVLMGSDGGKVFQSLDQGRTFTLISAGLPPEIIRSIKIIAFGATYAVTSGGSLYIYNHETFRWSPLWIDAVKGALAMTADPRKPWVLYLATQDGIYKSETSGFTWTKSNDGIESPPQVYTVTVDESKEGVLYAGGTSTVYRSIDAGATWKPYKEGLPPNSAVTSIEIDPVNPQVLLASLQDNGVYRSTDSGVSWNRLSSRLPVEGVSVIAIDPKGTGETLIGTYLEGLYVSRAGREFIRSAPGLTLFVRGLASDAGGRRLYAGALLGGIFVSDDNGEAWQNRGLLDRNIFDVQASPSEPGTVYVGTGVGLSRSRDSGQTWSDLIPRVSYLTAMAVDPRNRRIIYTGSLAGRLSRSADGGATWKQAGRGLPYLTILSLAVDGRDGTVYASLDGGGIYRSVNGGLDWTRSSSLLVGSNYSAQVIRVSPRSGAVYAASKGAGIFVSPDRGGFWSSINGDLPSYEVSDIAFDAAERVYVSTLNAGVYRTADIGKSWQAVSEGLPQQPVISLGMTTGPRPRILAATGSGVRIFNEETSSWDKFGDSLEGGIITSVTANADASVIYLQMEGVGVLKSADSGKSWTTVNSLLSKVGVRYLEMGENDNEAFAGSQGRGLVRTIDGGETWNGSIEPQYVEPAVLAVRLDPTNPNRIYAGTAGAGILVSDNGGLDWTPSNQGLTAKQILSLAIDPSSPSTLYAGTVGGGVFVSDDGALSWRQLPTGMFNQTVTSLTLDAANPLIVYAGTEGGGVFRFQRNSRSK
jgi:photosystem II stability/assembly factor-like uncharacterized protein